MRSSFIQTVVFFVAFSLLATTADCTACPMTTKVTCPLCYDLIDTWNTEGSMPSSIDAFCSENAIKWKPSYETLTGREFSLTKEKTRCVAVATGLQAIVRHPSCALPKCDPTVGCAAYC